MQNQTLISIRGLSKTYQRGAEVVPVLSGLDLDVDRGAFIALMGPSGSGKTTLLNLLCGIDRPDEGKLSIGGIELTALSDPRVAKWRSANIGLVFQLYHLLPVLNAARNVELPLLLTRLNRRERQQRVLAALSLAGLQNRERHRPAELSGGEKQRVGIARAIVSDPPLLLCDEPTGDLDRRSGDEILKLLRVLASEKGKTVIMVTHDRRSADQADRLYTLEDGRIVDETIG